MADQPLSAASSDEGAPRGRKKREKKVRVRHRRHHRHHASRLENMTTVGPTTFTFTATGLKPGTATATVTAVNAVGESVASNVQTFVIAGPTPTAATAPVPVGGPAGITWNLDFDDHFDGTSLDLSKWSNQDGGHMNNVTTWASNISVANSTCILTLASSTSGAEICTSNYLLPVNGYTEARVLFPGNGTTIYNWPAWWASGPDWPNNGENDIAEGLGTLTVNYHSGSGSHNQGTVPGNWAGKFHTYGLYRQSGKSSVYWDGVLVKSYSTDDQGGGQNLIANVGSGNQQVYGNGGQVLVDYVRAWVPA